MAQHMLVLEWHLPAPMPTSTIRPREIWDTISLFTGMSVVNESTVDDVRREKTCDRCREHALDYCPHPFLVGFKDGMGVAVYTGVTTPMGHVI